ncbi:MAG TPA: hypothetical protein VEZ71_12705 [Archangium sp.]|nr:hypothetical protein [Archangium sp.]
MTLHRSILQSAGLSLAVLLLGGFTQEPHVSSTLRSASGAPLAPGDVAPGKLYARDATEALGKGLVSVSNPASPKLVATDAQGVERPGAEAQVTDLLGAGTHTLTLRFEAGHAGLSKLDGTYSLRGLQLYSLGTNTLYHRLAKGLDIRMPAVRASELAAAEVTPAIDGLLRAGEFDVGQ